MLIPDREALKDWRNRQTHSKIVAVSGCFDILHAGHVHYFKEAKKLGTVLVVGLNADNSIRNLKGPNRPINPQADRAEMLLSLRVVDYVYIFHEVRATEFLSLVRPHFWVKGSDYSIDTINQDERNAVESAGGKIQFVPLRVGLSTTLILDALNK